MSAAWTENNIPRLDGKVALVTGANSGLGLEAARLLAAHGARVLMACRNLAKAERAAADVHSTANGADLDIVPLDLAGLASVAEAAPRVLESEPRLDLLMNNAGLMAVDESKTEDGFETQFGVNHLGHFALTAQLAPLVLATPQSRIVNMSSFGHRLGRLRIDDLNFERRGTTAGRRISRASSPTCCSQPSCIGAYRSEVVDDCLAAHPGATATDLGHEGGGITNKVTKPLMPLMQSSVAGTLPFVRAATDPAAKGGEYYGPRLMFRGRPRLETPSRRARNADDARALWARSEKLTGLPFAIPPP